MNKILARIFKIDDGIAEAKDAMYKSVTKAAATSGLISLTATQHHEQCVKLNEVLRERGSSPIVIAAE